jgi:tight adherence protein C
MLTAAIILIFIAGLMVVIGVKFNDIVPRPTLKMHEFGGLASAASKKSEAKAFSLFSLLRGFAILNKPLISADMRRQMSKNLGLSHMGITPEEHLLIKEIVAFILAWLALTLLSEDMRMMGMMMGLAAGWIFPDMWLRGKINKVKEEIVKKLPDTVDLLGLCVNAGLDFMMALKWVVEKSAPSALISELNNILQEINVGKPRRDALRDFAKKYELPDLSTFARTLIQADKMGTSVSEALNILSEDMRVARFRRGEALALKAPLKMLAPLLFCIFPVVGILVAAPIFLDFMYNNPMKQIGGGG